MVSKDILRENLSIIAQNNPKLVEKLSEYILSDKLPLIEIKENELDITFHDGKVSNLLKKSKKKIDNLEENIGLIFNDVPVEKLTKFKSNILKLRNWQIKDKKHFFHNINTLFILGTLPFFHIKDLINKKDNRLENLKKLLIYEGRLDFLYIFLSTVNLTCVKNIEIKIHTEEKNFLIECENLLRISPYVAYLKSYEDENIKQVEEKVKYVFTKSSAYMKTESVIYAIRNTINNLKKSKKFDFLKKGAQVNKNFPVIIVASGPSLDKGLERLKEVQHKVFIVALSTSLPSLLKAGIKPDLLSVADPHKVMFDYFKEVSKEYNLSDIPVIALLAVNSRLLSIFKETHIIGFSFLDKFLRIPNEVDKIETYFTVLYPTLKFIINLGLKEIFLLGTDLGTKYPERLHSTEYVLKDLEKKLTKSYPYILEGNFGGKVYSKIDYYGTKLKIEELIKDFQGEIFNLSDGAKIEGTIPLPPEEFPTKVKDSNIDKGALRNDIRRLFIKTKIDINEEVVYALRKKLDSLRNIKKALNNLKKTKDYALFLKLLESLLWDFSNSRYIRGLIYMDATDVMLKILYEISLYAFEKKDSKSLKLCLESSYLQVEQIINVIKAFDEIY